MENDQGQAAAVCGEAAQAQATAAAKAPLAEHVAAAGLADVQARLAALGDEGPQQQQQQAVGAPVGSAAGAGGLLAPAVAGAATKSLGGALRGALSGLAGVVAQAASAAGLEGLAGSLAAAAEERAVNFEAAVGDTEGSSSVPAAGRSLSQRLRSGVKRSLSMSRRMRFGDAWDADTVEGLHFSLTERQHQVRSEATGFAAEVADPAEVRAREAAGTFPREALAAAAGRGYGRLLVPVSQGGLGLGADTSCGVMGALGASDMPLAALLAAHNAANYLLSTYGTSKMHEKLVRQMSALTSLGTLAVSEAPGGSDPVCTACCVEKDVSGQFYTLNGSKAWVAGGASSDVFLVLARSSAEARKGLSLFTVTRNMPGVSLGRPAALAGWRSCPVVPLSFSRVVVRTEHLVGREGQGAELMEEAYGLLRTWLAAAAVSYGEALLQSATEAAGGGNSGSSDGGLGGLGGALGTEGLLSGGGGGPLGRPAVQAEVARVKAQLQAARLMCRAAAQQLDCKSPGANCEACTAKCYAVRAAQRAADITVHILGWSAVQPDQPCHAAMANLYAADFVGGPPDSLYGTIFAEISRVSAA